MISDHGKNPDDIDAQSSMGSPRSWDSMVFVEIFESIGTEFGLDLSDDDAVHFMSVAEIVEFVESN
ncbi:MAG: acyl carrier protein [Ilumatobacteraceae bacterium]